MDFSKLTVLCAGDIMLDRFVHGDVERISPEAPVPVIRLRETREMLGGAGNVASNISSLGGRAILVGLIGGDDSGQRLRRLVEDRGRVVPALVETTQRPTICKTRFFAGRQQVVRADEESSAPLHESEEHALLACLDAHLVHVQAVILSDYGKGVLSRGFLARAIAAARAYGLPVFIDPKRTDFACYAGATCITPNLREFAAASGATDVETEEGIAAAAAPLLERADAAAILVTRSERGMTLVERNGDVSSAPARAREVFDVSGAGDTVIATLALAHASGRSLAAAMHVANAAAGVVVSKLGTATADIAEVMHELAAQDTEAASAGLTPRDQAAALVSRWRDQGYAVGFTNGCFDILHPGHVSLLAFSRRQCDRLVVALNTDASISRLKGPGRPVNELARRAQVMAAIRYVDCVVAFDEDTPLELIGTLLPDVLVKGADYTTDQVIGGDIVRAAGGRVVLAELVPGQSTTGLIARMREAGT